MKIRATAYYNFGNAVYLSLQNDLSFVVDFDLWFLEHQSTDPNMPVCLLYLASEYSKLNTDDLLYSNKLQMLDTPHFVVFYNGTDPSRIQHPEAVQCLPE